MGTDTAQDFGRLVDINHHRSFGDLEAQHLRGETLASGGSQYLRLQPVAVEL